MEEKTYQSSVTLCDDGKYRWVYELNLYKNPTVFLLVWKIFFLIFLGIFAVTNISDALNWGAQKVVENLPVFGYVILGMTALTALGYLLYAAMMGGKYIVEFQMDEKGISHKQREPQAKKANQLGKATIFSGAASGNPTMVGIGMNAQRTEMYSDFCKVKKVKSYPLRHLIKVNALFSHNQVYTTSEDFSFVKNYIISHCDNIKK